MAGTQSRYEWQFKQRLTSGGLNSQTAYLARNTSEAMHAFTGYDHETALQTGVIRGLTVSVVAGTMRISIAPGIGQFHDATISEPDSKSKWVELAAALEKTLTAADAANPRWDVVEIQPTVVNGAAEIIDFYNPNDNTFSPAVVSVQKLSVAAAQVRAGTPGANPKFLAGVANWMPLAYVYVGATVVELNVDRVLHCRPILTPRRGAYRNEDPTSIFSPYFEGGSISGGGWAIAANGYDGTLAAAMTGTFPNGGLPFVLPGNTNVGLITGNYEGGGLPAGNTLVHAYVAPPPYPSGYDASLAPRELYIKDVATPNCQGTIPAGSRNCIVLTSSSGPSLTSPLGQRGGPNSNTGTFTDNLWGAFTRIRSNLLYIGAAFHAIAVPGLIAQRVQGATVSTSRKPGAIATADLPIVAPTTYSMWANIVGDPDILWPETAVDIDMQVRATVASNAELVIEIEDYFGIGGNIGMMSSVFCNTSGGSQRVGDVVPINLTPAGSVQINYANDTDVASLRLYGKCYRDAVLRQR